MWLISHVLNADRDRYADALKLTTFTTHRFNGRLAGETVIAGYLGVVGLSCSVVLDQCILSRFR